MPREGDSSKRKQSGEHFDGRDAKKSKGGKKAWRVPRKNEKGEQIRTYNTIDAGDAGIWATCNLNMETRCKMELIDLFEEYAQKLYGSKEDDEEENTHEGDDIEAAIQRELEELKKPKKSSFISYVRTDTQCVLFFKTKSPVNPVELVRAVCRDAAQSGRIQKTRYARRLVPSSLIGKATEKGLEQVAEAVLGPVFHGEANTHVPKKFAIRPSIRHHTQMKRDDVIKQTAAAVGPEHKVDLKNYEHLILLEIHKNVLGMSVVPGDYEELRRYNLAELYELSEPKQEEKEVEEEVAKKEMRSENEGEEKAAMPTSEEKAKAVSTET